MKIYTKTGDDGTTGLFGGARVGKDDALVEAYGTVDETNAALGIARAAGVSEVMNGLLASIQADLFVLGAELACVQGKQDKLRMDLIGDAHVARLEVAIDSNETALEPLQTFILPGGTPGAAALHFARTVCRRAERRTLLASRAGSVRPQLLVYLNRLSDLLFVLARRANHDAGLADLPWVPR
jgi:cob(I)alamin adenosyltransferase